MELYFIRHQLYIAGCLYLGQILVGYGMGWTAPVIPKLQDLEQSPLPEVITEQEASWIGSLLYVGTISGEQEPNKIAELFAQRFKVVPEKCSSIWAPAHGAGDTGPIHVFTPNDVMRAVRDMKRGKSPGHDGLSIEHIQWASHLIYTKLSPYVTGFLSNIKGRKPCLFLGATVSILSFLMLGLASNLAMLYAGRILIGLGTGIIFVINLVYIGEIASTHIRGILLTCTGIFSTLGTLIVYAIGPYVPYAATAYTGLALTLLYTVGIFFVPETPLFLIMKGEHEAAKAVLTKLGRDDEFDKVLLAKEDISKEKSSKDQWTEIISVRSNRRAFFITLSLNILQQMSGVVAMVFFATTIFELAESTIAPDLATIVIGITQIAASTITPFFVERSGRKSLLLVSTAACCLSLGTLGTYFYLDHVGNEIVRSVGWLPLVTLIIFFLSYDLGFGIIPGTFIGEMFTPNVRSTGSTVTVTIGWLFGFFVSSAFGLMVANGAFIAFWVYAGACAAAFVFTAVFVPETRGKSLLDIQEMLSVSWF